MKASATTLTCTAGTAPGRPVTFQPSIGLLPRAVEARGTVYLGTCTSPNGRATRLRTGRLIFDGTATASCASATGVSGQARIAWYNARGRYVGTSVLRADTSSLTSSNPADAFMTGAITSGPLAGRHASAQAAPSSSLTNCALQGVSSLSGTGRMTIS
ncbi:hypothetical protein GCM10022224_035830 [Nonomuraea antimicrobica]|uniref:Ig-like domain-containing protein n=1 Tax=Nonomuraea antimicrobica TaxID=561173 RepID=A0ABP7BRV7_9ACTN